MIDRVRSRLRSDRGAVIVMAGTAMVGLMISVALVVDLGLVRQIRRNTQATADLAALAAGPAVGDLDGPTACSDALTYIEANEPSWPSSLSVPCSSLPSICVDSVTSPVTVTDGGTGGAWSVSITYPVSDASIADPDVAAANSLRAEDGTPCERLRVDISRTMDSLFGGIVGRDSFTVDSSAVVREINIITQRIPALWLLDPWDCPVLDVQGGSNVTVGSTINPGLVTIDSDASACTGGSVTVDVGGSTSGLFAIPDFLDPGPEINLVAMLPGQADCATGELRACDPADVAAGVLDPQPTRSSRRFTREPVDHLYNCKSGYPDYHGLPIGDCEAGLPPYVDQLRSEVGASGTPSGFQTWSSTYGCNNPALPPTGVNGNWHVDCATFKVTSVDVVFNGGNVVFDGDISATGGSITFNSANPNTNLPLACQSAIVGCIDQSAATAAWIYMRSGQIKLTGGALTVLGSTLIQDGGHLEITGGSPPVWSPPSEGPFKALSVWSELLTSKYSIAGGASMELSGTFFTPEAAPFTISGGAPVTPQLAQFISYRLAVSGGASLTLAPNAETGIAIPETEPLLIR
jgi:hypothetical protein